MKFHFPKLQQLHYELSPTNYQPVICISQVHTTLHKFPGNTMQNQTLVPPIRKVPNSHTSVPPPTLERMQNRFYVKSGDVPASTCVRACKCVCERVGRGIYSTFPCNKESENVGKWRYLQKVVENRKIFRDLKKLRFLQI